MTGDGARTFEWDAENRLVAVVKGTHRSEFGYDGFGHRVDIRELDADANGNWVTSVDTKYVWFGSDLMESRTADGTTTLQRYFAQGFLDSDGTALYFTKDHLGSTRELVDAFGSIRARYDYDPWGRATKIAGDKDSPFLYTGHLWNPASGLYLAAFRVYDPNLGRWISKDPSGEESCTNLYMYGDNDPIDLMDPTGLSSGPGFPWNLTGEPWFQSLASTGDSFFGTISDALSGNLQKNASLRNAQGPFGQMERLANPCSHDLLDQTASDMVDAMKALAEATKNWSAGTFKFGGREWDLGEGGAFMGGIVEDDSDRGTSTGELNEYWAGGELGDFGVGKITSTSGSPFGGWFLFGGTGVSLGPIGAIQVGVVQGVDQGWTGFYWEGHVGTVSGGGGVYVNHGGQ